MGILIAAYLIGWVAVSGYVSWLAAQNTRLARRIEDLETRLADRAGDHPACSKAA